MQEGKNAEPKKKTSDYSTPIAATGKKAEPVTGSISE